MHGLGQGGSRGDLDQGVRAETRAQGHHQGGVAKVELTKAQTERIAKMLGSGMEVRLAVGGEDAVRLYPCAATDFKTMFVAAETMGEFRHAAYRGRHLSFTSRNGRRRVEEDEIEERAAHAAWRQGARTSRPRASSGAPGADSSSR